MADLKAAGIDYDDVIAVLEREGVEKFEASWNELLATVQGQLDQAKAAQ
jgi:transaldolase